jgi:hypothetical protein
MRAKNSTFWALRSGRLEIRIEGRGDWNNDHLRPGRKRCYGNEIGGNFGVLCDDTRLAKLMLCDLNNSVMLKKNYSALGS